MSAAGIAGTVLEVSGSTLGAAFDLVGWLAEFSSSLVGTLLSIGAWLVMISGIIIMALGMWLPGGLVFAFGLVLYVLSKFLGLVAFWFSKEHYPFGASALASEIVWSIVSVVLLGGMFLAAYFFWQPENWLLAIAVTTIPLCLVASAFSIAKHFLAVVKDAIAKRAGEVKKAVGEMKKS